MFLGFRSLSPSVRTIVSLRPANDNDRAGRDYLRGLTLHSGLTRDYLRAAEWHLREIRKLLLGNDPRTPNHR